MAINRRQEQNVSSSGEGCEIRTLTDASTGSKMLTVLDINLAPGGELPYRANSAHEESFFIADGDVTFKLADATLDLTKGDCVLVKKGDACGATNVGDSSARIISVCPDPDPIRDEVAEPSFTKSEPGDNVLIRAENAPFEFAPGVWRVDMVGDFRGATSTYFSELRFEAGATTPNHFHPAHEEAMFCFEGDLSAVYGDEDTLPLPAGDVFLCEPTVRHTVNNHSDQSGTLLAIHPVLNPPPRVLCD